MPNLQENNSNKVIEKKRKYTFGEESLGKMVKRKREEKGLSKTELSEMLDISRKTLYNIENDIYIPKDEYFNRILDFMGLKIRVMNKHSTEITEWRFKHPNEPYLDKVYVSRFRAMKKRNKKLEEEQNKINKKKMS